MAFQFQIEVVETIPTNVRDQSANSHPFPWDQLAESVRATGKPAKFVVPKAYWVEERGMEADKYKALTAREKIRSTFTNWKNRDASREDLTLVMRTVSDGVEVFVKTLAPGEAHEEAPSVAPAETPAPTSDAPAAAEPDQKPKKAGK